MKLKVVGWAVAFVGALAADAGVPLGSFRCGDTDSSSSVSGGVAVADGMRWTEQVETWVSPDRTLARGG